MIPESQAPTPLSADSQTHQDGYADARVEDSKLHRAQHRDPVPADLYRPGDRVIGEDEGTRIFGTVSAHYVGERAERHAKNGDVLVYWSGEDYAPSSLGHLAPAELLRLWPAAAHAARVTESLRTTEAGATT